MSKTVTRLTDSKTVQICNARALVVIRRRTSPRHSSSYQTSTITALYICISIGADFGGTALLHIPSPKLLLGFVSAPHSPSPFSNLEMVRKWQRYSPQNQQNTLFIISKIFRWLCS